MVEVKHQLRVTSDVAYGHGGERTDSAAATPADAHCPFCLALVAEQVGLPWPRTPRRCRSCERWIGPNRAVDAQSAPAAEAPSTAVVDARCPHCRSVVAERVRLPWPPAPQRCSKCERWIGRNRIVTAPGGEQKRIRAPRPRPRVHADEPTRARRTPTPTPAAAAFARPRAPDAGSDLRRASLRLYEVTFASCRKVLGPDHPQTLAAGHDLATARAATGDHDGAIRLYKRTLARREAALGTDHRDTRATRKALDELDAGGTTPRLDSAARRAHERLAAAGGALAGAGERLGRAAPVAEAVVGRARAAGQTAPVRRLLRARAAREVGPRTPLGRVVRAAAVAMLVIGALVITDAAITLFWQEPITALIAAHNQGRVNHQLDRLFAGARLRAARQRETSRLIAQQAAALDLNTPLGHPLGQLRIPRIGIKFAVIQGENEPSLELGPGHYPQTPLPGAAGHWTVGIAGHRTTYLAPFRNVDQLRRGDAIFLTMPYARFTYVVDRTIIVDPSDPTIFTAVGYNRLALTACNPPFSAAQRIIVYARQTRMAPLVKTETARRAPRAPLERLWHGGLT